MAAGVVAVGLAIVYADWHSAAPPDALRKATYIGRASCVDCHRQEHADWTGSHHDLAMDLATDESVIADFQDAVFERLGVTTRFFRDGDRFMVNTEGPDGEFTDFEVKYTFGVDPLQQYMVEFPDGRVQVLRVSWDTHKKEWFYVPPPDATDERLAPDDPTHWTGVAQNWNTTCAICHSTNLQKNYDLASDTYKTTYSEIDVSCEECHGPASLHVELAGARSLFWDRRHGYGLAKLKSTDSTTQIEACAKCHSRRNAVHPNFRPGTPLLDSYEPVTLQAGLYHADGQILDEVYVYGSFVQSKMHAKGVRCTDCHNPHSLKLEQPGNLMCAKCHEPAKYDVVAHHHHPAGSIGAQCVECHMPSTTYMVVDPRRDHSLRVPRPDLTVATGAPNACNGCHTKQGEDAAWAAAKVREWYGEPDNTKAWHWATAIAAGREGEPEGEQLLSEVAGRLTAPAIVRATAIELLPQYSGQRSAETIVAALDAMDPGVRLAAVRSTSADSPAELVGRIGDRLLDSTRAVRVEAARRLAGLPADLFRDEQLEARNSALAEYRERQAADAEHPESHLNLANLAMRLNDRYTAIEELRTALRLAPYRSFVRYELASILEGMGGDKQEVRNLREEEEELLVRDSQMLPDNGEIQYRLGLLRYKLGKLPEAEEALVAAVRLDPRSYQYRFGLALLQEDRYMKSRDEQHFTAAVKTLEAVNKMSPDDPQATAVLRRLLAAQQAYQAEADTDR